MEPYYSDDLVALYHGDCLEVLRELPDGSVDSVCTDPPYGLEFMGKGWDAPWVESGINADAAFGAVEMSDGYNRLPRPTYTGSTNPKCLVCNGNRRGRRDGTAKVAVCVCADGGHFPNVRAVEMRAFGQWCSEWVTECLRVLKPGGYLVAFGGSRTWHRLACAVEDAGFEVRDSIAWLYSTGFPKSLNLGGKWQGWGTTLKPAFEPIVVARKPLAGTVAQNVLNYGCGAINIDGCRVQADGGSGEGRRREAPARGCRVHDVRPVRGADGAVAIAGQAGEVAHDVRTGVPERADARGEQPQLARGQLAVHEVRLPPGGDGELVPGGPGAPADATAEGVPGAPSSHGPEGGQAAHDGRDGAPHQRREGRQSTGEPAPDRLGRPQQGAPADRARTDATTGGEHPTPGCTCGTDREATRVGESSADRRYTDKGGTNFAPLPGVRGGSPAGRWPTNVLLDDSQAAVLDEQAPNTGAGGRYGDSGGASRFFPTFRHEAKAPSSERPVVDGVQHPTVKPLELMRWLVRLVTPPGGIVLDPFAGSGTTAEACVLEHMQCITIERETDYLPLIVERLTKPLQVGFDFEATS